MDNISVGLAIALGMIHQSEWTGAKPLLAAFDESGDVWFMIEDRSPRAQDAKVTLSKRLSRKLEDQKRQGNFARTRRV